MSTTENVTKAPTTANAAGVLKRSSANCPWDQAMLAADDWLARPHQHSQCRSRHQLRAKAIRQFVSDSLSTRWKCGKPQRQRLRRLHGKSWSMLAPH